MAYFNKFRGTKGFISGWERLIRFQYMISEEAKRRTKILAFWEKYGEEAARADFGELQNCVSNFAGNGFELCCKYTPEVNMRYRDL